MAEGIVDMELSSTEELENLQPGDDTATLTLAIPRFDPRKQRPGAPPPKKDLLRAIGSNLNGAEIRLLFWEELAAKYRNLILRKIIEITRPRVTPENPMFRDRYQDLLHVELSIQKSTGIKILGPMAEEILPEPDLQDVNLVDIAAFVGRTIRVTGYVKSLFARNAVGNVSYGSGSLTDGRHNCLAHITNFDTQNNPVLGAHVRVQGQVRRNHLNTLLLQIMNMTDIVIVDDQILDSRALKQAFRRIPDEAPVADVLPPAVQAQGVGIVHVLAVADVLPPAVQAQGVEIVAVPPEHEPIQIAQVQNDAVDPHAEIVVVVEPIAVQDLNRDEHNPVSRDELQMAAANRDGEVPASALGIAEDEIGSQLIVSDSDDEFPSAGTLESRKRRILEDVDTNRVSSGIMKKHKGSRAKKRVVKIPSVPAEIQDLTGASTSESD